MINLKEGVEPDPTSRATSAETNGDQSRQVRPVPRLQRVPGVREHAGAETPEPGADGEAIEEDARTAASRWR